MTSRKISLSILTILLFSSTVIVGPFAQELPKSKESPPVETDVLIEGASPLMFEMPLPPPGEGDHLFTRHVISSGAPGGNFGWIASEMSFGGKPVKGAPYSAEAVTETTQTLSDGNRIQHKNSASVYRDSEGRTRKEQTLSGIGPWAAAGDPPQTIFINDPVAGVNFVLNPKDKTARKLSPPTFVSSGKGEVKRPAEAARRIEINETAVYSPAAGVAMSRVHLDENSPKPDTVSLGKRVIEGVETEGTRTTTTIPAGQIGNELPINIVSERWFSPELQVVVMSKHNDPRMGETVYRLTSINRSEQPASLFEVPADYTIKEGGPFIRRRLQTPKSAEAGTN